MPIVASRMVSTAETRSSTGRPSQYAPSRLTASSGVVQVNTLSITSSLARERRSTPAKLPNRPPRSPVYSQRATTERGRRRCVGRARWCLRSWSRAARHRARRSRQPAPHLITRPTAPARPASRPPRIQRRSSLGPPRLRKRSTAWRGLEVRRFAFAQPEGPWRWGAPTARRRCAIRTAPSQLPARRAGLRSRSGTTVTSRSSFGRCRSTLLAPWSLPSLARAACSTVACASSGTRPPTNGRWLGRNSDGRPRPIAPVREPEAP